MQGRLLSPLTMKVASMPLTLVSTQVPLISSSYTFSKAAVFQKTTGVIAIVSLTHFQDCEGDKLSIRANALFPLLPQSSVQKGGNTLGACGMTIQFQRVFS